MRSGLGDFARRIPQAGLGLAVRPFDLFFDPALGQRGRWLVLSIVVGAVSGLGAILFDLLYRASQAIFLEGIGTFRPPGSGVEGGAALGPIVPWLLPVSLVAGALISGILVFGLAPEAEGHGTDAVIRSFHHQRGAIRRRVPLVKAVASAVTIGSGGSAGREGPIAQIGAGFGSFVADLLKLPHRDRRVLMLAGVAGGVGSIFRAPLGAALFAAEVLYRRPDFEYEALLPGLISSITGYAIYSSYAGWGLLFDTPRISFHEPRELAGYALLGLFCALVGNVYPRIFYGFRDRVFRRLPLPRWLAPAAGALALGLIAVAFPPALGMGYGYVQQAIDGGHAIAFLLLFAAVKIVATSLTISSGGSGGVFGPSLVIGGALGAAFGQAAVLYAPAIAPPPAACVLVGMGGFFAGVAKVPLASVIMVMEMTGSYGLLVPSLLVATIAYLLVPPRTQLYENQVDSRADSPAHLGSFALDVLRRLPIRDVWEPPPSPPRTVRHDATLASLVDLASEAPQNLFPIVDDDGRLLGELSIDNLRRGLVSHDPARQREITARSLARQAAGPLVPEDDLALAARLLADRRSDAVIVVRDRSTREILGLFSRRDLVVAYGRHIESLHKAEA
jgi:CIC family chloride channel protein